MECHTKIQSTAKFEQKQGNETSHPQKRAKEEEQKWK